MKKPLYTIGIDEVGRGPIAGPVAVGAFVFLKPKAKKLFKGVKESKQLSENKREEWFRKILEVQKSGQADFCVTFQSEKVIDTKGLSFAIKKCLETSLNSLGIDPEKCQVLLDGGLKAPAKYGNQKTIIKGDTKEITIALASICAKVLRDRKMRVFAKKYPNYGFDIHKGYGTRAHYEALEKYSFSGIHRKTFIHLLNGC
ncbi:MAG: ribonuclease HII [Patescibacteria group bacterium]